MTTLAAALMMSAAGVVGIIWWNSGMSRESMVDAATDEARRLGVIRPRLVSSKRMGDEDGEVVFEVRFQRHSFRWGNVAWINPSGTLPGQLVVECGAIEGSWGPVRPRGPAWLGMGSKLVCPPGTAEKLWSDLASQPENAAFDAFTYSRRATLVEGRLILFSALRRLEEWDSMLDLMEDPAVLNNVSTSPKIWQKRFANEVRALGKAKLTPTQWQRYTISFDQLKQRKGLEHLW